MARPEPVVTVEITGDAGKGASADRVVRELQTLCGRRGVTQAAVRVSFRDLNGPKGGRDQRSAITMRVPRRRAIHVERTEATAELAWRSALDTLGQQLQALFAERRAQARRPKKYYVARRLQS